MRGGDEVVAERLAHVLVQAGVRGAQHHALRVVQVDQEAVLGQELLLLDCGVGWGGRRDGGIYSWLWHGLETRLCTENISFFIV